MNDLNFLYEKQPCINAFLMISSWFGISQRSGVWTFYESADSHEIEITLQYLKTTNENELADIFKKGIHDYQNPIYTENFNYPKEWIEESEKIDKWISDNEDLLWKWEYRLLINNRDLITSL